jgi:hypothetical protein
LIQLILSIDTIDTINWYYPCYLITCISFFYSWKLHTLFPVWREREEDGLCSCLVHSLPQERCSGILVYRSDLNMFETTPPESYFWLKLYTEAQSCMVLRKFKLVNNLAIAKNIIFFEFVTNLCRFALKIIHTLF